MPFVGIEVFPCKCYNTDNGTEFIFSERIDNMFRMGKEEIDAVARVISSGYLFKVNDGPYQETANCEKEMRELFKVDRALLMTSGQAALTSALVAMGVGPGDEVIVPAYTYIATAMAVVASGAMPVVAEIDDTLMIDPVDVEAKITDKTKAIIPVHMMGYPCNMDAIMDIAKKHNLKVLEDSCQADGGSFGGKRLGTIGDAGALSFNYFKIISAGEGGALLTNNQEIFEKALIFHDSSAVAYFGDQMQGFSAEPFCGSEFRTNEITAAIMREQFKKLDGILEDARRNKKLLIEEIAPYFDICPVNDPEGDCSITLTVKFDTAEKAKAFTEKTSNTEIPGNTGKHVCNYWGPILKKNGAANPLMNPFNFEANKGFEFPENMCKKSIDYLVRCVHIKLDPNWTVDDIKAKAKELIDAVK